MKNLFLVLIATGKTNADKRQALASRRLFAGAAHQISEVAFIFDDEQKLNDCVKLAAAALEDTDQYFIIPMARDVVGAFSTAAQKIMWAHGILAYSIGNLKIGLDTASKQ